MNKYIVIAFAFLGVWFYEASGGADFEPGNNSLVVFAEPKAVPPRPEPRAELVARASTATPLPVVDRTSAPDVSDTTAGLTLISVEVPDPIPAPTRIIEPEPVTEVVDASQELVFEIEPVFGLEPVIEMQPVVELESIIEDVVRDVRFVDGDLVNMRSGPGTDYAVVTQLLRNDLVEVITDNGDGWLQLRDVVSGQEGWMADWLVTASN